MSSVDDAVQTHLGLVLEVTILQVSLLAADSVNDS
eukprot:CAMPEP_0117025706 /NCGR_PEP_ID=MMETSP0472-20121206/18967_1 /TAXON_ID=693140 ORGANISM="Tiarina fusus, Strain LIS" /NCGR_SAMPLE_ID=MMETSP0472 /ASSEMBLY_ACC=CAM_ASM_000603 /LENGTH=34 /DNA_ID= /DNA_START= /DNA_END= /DNA_ORIENTATION=